MQILAHAEILWIDDWWPLIPVAGPAIAIWIHRARVKARRLLTFHTESAGNTVDGEVEINAEEETKKAFPNGAEGDVMFHTAQMELVFVEEVTMLPHVHNQDETEPHRHVYLPSRLGAVRRAIAFSSDGKIVTVAQRYETWVCKRPELLMAVEPGLSIEQFKRTCEEVKAAMAAAK